MWTTSETVIRSGAGSGRPRWRSNRSCGGSGDFDTWRCCGKPCRRILESRSVRRLPDNGSRHFSTRDGIASSSVLLQATLPSAATLDLTVFGINGGVVRRLVSQAALPAGFHSLSWDGRDDRGATLAGGVYFVRMQVGDGVHGQKVVLLP